MKKAVLGVILCLSLAVFGFSGGFSIKLNGGANFLMGGDYNKIVEDANAYWHSVSGLTFSSDLSKLSMGWNFGAEFIYSITDQMGIGLGVGYITASNESTLDMQTAVVYQSYAYTPSLSVIPITLNFHYFMPVSDMMNVHFSAGPGLYISSFSFADHMIIGILPSTDALNLTIDYQPDGILAFGFQGGLGIEFAISPNISLCLDVLGRVASLSGFSGDWTRTGTLLGNPVSDSGTGTFYYYESEGYSSFYISATMPSGSGITNAREASISLSGVCAMLGIKINI